MKKSFLFLICVLFVAGCATKPIIKTQPKPEAPKEEATQNEPGIRYADWQSVDEIKTINFDYDKSDLSSAARDILKENSKFLEANKDINVLVEGHCDERGTTEYNLALGQRRAQAVREYYGKLGISLGRIGTISYGKEKPLDPGHNEDAWAKNRRAETKVRSTNAAQK
jgi:peptidoglycan-associated lipoprotein